MLPEKLIKMLRSPRTIMSVLTLVVLAVIVYLSRHELIKAWELLGRANIWLLLLLAPLQVIVYYAGGEMIFSYLRQKKIIHHVSRFEQTRIALELNLVNHIFPSGGVSGISYTTWRLGRLDINKSKSIFAQIIRYVVGFLSFVALLIVSVLLLAIDGQINRYIVASSFLLVLVIIGLTIAVVYMFSSKERLNKLAIALVRMVNRVVCWFTFGRCEEKLNIRRVKAFFSEMQDDFYELLSDKRLLLQPLFWGLVYAVVDVSMYLLVFWSLGQSVNPAILMVGYGAAGLASLVALTPGGAGVYEVVMIFFLAMSGVSAQAAIAAIVLTRAILMTGTIVFGYIFYQQALWKYGKRESA